MKRVELITDGDCPNVQAARTQIERAFAEIGEPAEWEEWDRGDPNAPTHVREFGSPTILVDGRDVAGDGAKADANCCRVYTQGGRFQGVPAVENIVAPLKGRK